MSDKKKEQKNDNKQEIEKFKKRKIEEMEQDEQDIFIISKERNHINNQDNR